MDARYELRVVRPGGSHAVIVEWDGDNGEHAARRWADCHRGGQVLAWRNAPGYGVHALGRGARIVG